MPVTVIYPVLLIASIALFAVAGVRFWSRWSRRGWQETEAEVLYSDIRPMEGSSKGVFLGVCILAYNNKGTRFVGQFHFAKGISYARITRAARGCAAGSRQRILIRPDNPERVLLQSTNDTDVRFAAVCGVLGCLCTVAAFTLLRSA